MRITLLLVAVLIGACGKSQGQPESSPPPAAVATGADPRGALFREKGCPQCHSISAFGIKSQAEVGPDLTNAYEDVRNRFGTDLEHFLHAPTGTMQMVLSSMIKLSPAERDSVIHLLKELHEEREERAEGNHE